MIKLGITVGNVTALKAWLNKAANLDDVIGKALGEWAVELTDERLYGTRNYAAPPPGSRYIRTGRLGANWALARKGKTGVEFQNMTSYAGYVVGDGEGRGQARIHAGRWWLGVHKVEDGLDDAKERIGKAVEKALA